MFIYWDAPPPSKEVQVNKGPLIKVYWSLLVTGILGVVSHPKFNSPKSLKNRCLGKRSGFGFSIFFEELLLWKTSRGYRPWDGWNFRGCFYVYKVFWSQRQKGEPKKRHVDPWVISISHWTIHFPPKKVPKTPPLERVVSKDRQLPLEEVLANLIGIPKDPMGRTVYLPPWKSAKCMANVSTNLFRNEIRKQNLMQLGKSISQFGLVCRN